MAIAKALKTNSTLQELVLDGNKIGDDGAVALATALKSNSSTLLQLKLWHSAIHFDGLRAIAEALRTNSTLLELEHDPIDSFQRKDDGRRAFAKALEANWTRHYLRLQKHQDQR